MSIENGFAEPFGFQALPLDLKIRIFSYFTQEFLCTVVARVCKTWWELSKDPSLWKVLNVSWDSGETADDWFRALITRCTMLKELRIESDEDNESRVIHMVGDSFSSSTLKTLIIRSAVICGEFLTKLEQNFPSLESVKFNQCDIYGDSKGIVQKICKLSKLKKLKVSFLEDTIEDDIDDAALNTIAENFSSLRTLHLCCSVSSTSIQNLTRLRREILKKVNLVNCDFSDDGVSCFALCPGLTALSLSCTAFITDAAFDAIKELNLQKFALYCLDYFNVKVSSQGLSRFFGSPCRRTLRKLTLDSYRNLDDHVLIAVSKSCKNVTHLTIHDSERVTNMGMTICVEGLSNLSYLSCKFCPGVTWGMISEIPDTVQVVSDKVYSHSFNYYDYFDEFSFSLFCDDE